MVAPGAQPTAKEDLIKLTWTIEGVERIALVHVPPTANPATAAKDKSIKLAPAPVVLAFHGHGGNAERAAKEFRIHTLWPEAIVVYLQGLPTRGIMVDHEGKYSGWQGQEGQDGDRDLKFVDAVLASLKSDYKVDENRIYAMGHSNGGAYTYLLWHTRPDVFAAFAPAGAFTARVRNLKPKPLLQIAGRKDPLIKFEWQDRCVEAVKRLDGCDADAKGEANWDGCKDCTYYKSASNDNKTPVVTLFYDGGHAYPADEASPVIVKFFKEEVKSAASASPKR